MRAPRPSGDIGKLLSVTGSYTQDWLLQVTDYNWRVEPDGHTNLRAVADVGTHWMDLAQFVTGLKIERVIADLATFHPERRKPIGGAETFTGPAASARPTEPVTIVTEDYGAILMQFAHDVRGVYHVTQCTAGRKNRLALEISGTEGSLVWDSQEPELALDRPPRPLQRLFERDPGLMAPDCRRHQPLPRRPRRRLPRRLQATRPRLLRLDRQGLPPARPPSPPSPTATAKSNSARPSPTAASPRQWTQVAG